MTPEQKFWQLLKPHIPGHVNRVENSMGSGMPDVQMCYNGVDTWIEVKAKQLLPKENRLGDNILGMYIPCLRDSQLIWHSQRRLHKGRTLVIGRHEDTITGLSCCGYMEYICLLHEPKPWNWDKIERFIKGEK